jgi:hypothetical protein
LSAVLLKICARDADLDFLSTIDLIADLLSPVDQAIIYVISYELVADVLSTLGLVVLVFDSAMQMSQPWQHQRWRLCATASG